MKVRSLKIVGRESVVFPIVGVHPAAELIVTDIRGLGAPKRTVVIAQPAGGLAGVSQGILAEYREIVMDVKFGLNYGPIDASVDELREKIYALLSPGPTGVLDIELYSQVALLAKTQGIMESCEPIIFAKDPSVQIVIPCLEAPLIGPTEVTVGDPGAKASYEIAYAGTYPSGFRFEIGITGAYSEFFIEANGQKMTIDHDFVNGNTLIIDTREGRKEITKKVGAVSTNILGDMTPDSEWPSLYPGANTFFTGPTYTYNWVYAAKYTPRFWGV